MKGGLTLDCFADKLLADSIPDVELIEFRQE
jgi:hypothetical protein